MTSIYNIIAGIAEVTVFVGGAAALLVTVLGN